MYNDSLVIVKKKHLLIVDICIFLSFFRILDTEGGVLLELMI